MEPSFFLQLGNQDVNNHPICTGLACVYRVFDLDPHRDPVDGEVGCPVFGCGDSDVVGEVQGGCVTLPKVQSPVPSWTRTQVS